MALWLPLQLRACGPLELPVGRSVQDVQRQPGVLSRVLVRTCPLSVLGHSSHYIVLDWCHAHVCDRHAHRPCASTDILALWCGSATQGRVRWLSGPCSCCLQEPNTTHDPVGWRLCRQYRLLAVSSAYSILKIGNPSLQHRPKSGRCCSRLCLCLGQAWLLVGAPRHSGCAVHQACIERGRAPPCYWGCW